MQEKEKEVIDTCPVCGNGNVLKTSHGYYCDNHASTDGDKRCAFHLPTRYKGVTINDTIIRQLTNQGHTGYMTMQSMVNRPYVARLVAVKGEGITIETERKTMSVRCPKCGEEMVITRTGYSCAGKLREEPTCDFFIPNYTCRRYINETAAENFINGEPDIIDGFIGNNGKYFSAYITEKEGRRALESSVGKCPICGGNIYVGASAFNCSNYKSDDTGCNFMFYRHIRGHLLNLREARELCRHGRTLVPFESYDLQGHICYVSLVVNIDKCRVDIVRHMGSPQD